VADVTLALHFEGSVIASIKESTFSNVEEGYRMMLDWWLEGGCYEPVTWERLAEALQDSGFRKLAESLDLHGKHCQVCIQCLVPICSLLI